MPQFESLIQDFSRKAPHSAKDLATAILDSVNGDISNDARTKPAGEKSTKCRPRKKTPGDLSYRATVRRHGLRSGPSTNDNHRPSTEQLPVNTDSAETNNPVLSIQSGDDAENPPAQEPGEGLASLGGGRCLPDDRQEIQEELGGMATSAASAQAVGVPASSSMPTGDMPSPSERAVEEDALLNSASSSLSEPKIAMEMESVWQLISGTIPVIHMLSTPGQDTTAQIPRLMLATIKNYEDEGSPEWAEGYMWAQQLRKSRTRTRVQIMRNLLEYMRASAWYEGQKQRVQEVGQTKKKTPLSDDAAATIVLSKILGTESTILPEEEAPAGVEIQWTKTEDEVKKKGKHQFRLPRSMFDIIVVLYYRHVLQRRFLARDRRPKADDMQTADVVFTGLTGMGKIERKIVRITKIDKVLEEILKLNNIPKNDQYKFTERSNALIAKWGQRAVKKINQEERKNLRTEFSRGKKVRTKIISRLGRGSLLGKYIW